MRSAALPRAWRRGSSAAPLWGGALASPYYYGPGPGYYEPGYYPPRYYAPGPGYVADDYYGGGCVWQKQRFWDGYAWRVRRVRVCG